MVKGGSSKGGGSTRGERGEINELAYSIYFFIFSIYGRWRPLDSLKTVSWDLGTFSTSGKASSGFVGESLFLTQN